MIFVLFAAAASSVCCGHSSPLSNPDFQAGPTPQPSAAPAPPNDRHAVRVPTTVDEALSLLSLYDGKVRALEWTSRVTSPNAKCPPPLSTCEGALSEDQRYRVRVELNGALPNGGCVTSDGDINFDGTTIISVTHRQKTWMRRGEQFDLWMVHGPLTLLGRGGVSQRPVNPSRQLLGGWAQALETAPSGDVAVSALVECGGTVELVKVTMRPSLQMAPVRIETIDPVFQYASRIITTTEWTSMDGVPLPAKGVVEVFSIALTEAQAVAMTEAAKKRGMKNLKDWWPTEPAKLVLAREALIEALNGDTIKPRPSALGRYDVSVTYKALNEKVVVPQPPKPVEGYTRADDFTGEVIVPPLPSAPEQGVRK